STRPSTASRSLSASRGCSATSRACPWTRWPSSAPAPWRRRSAASPRPRPPWARWCTWRCPMSKLRVPLKRYLVDEVPEAALHEVWQGIRKRRTRRAPPVPLRFAWVGLVAAFIVSSVLWLTFHEAPGPLATLDGAPPRTLGGPRPERVVLSDGSAIELAEQSSLEVLSNDRESFVTVLRQGRGTFDVKPGGSRRWRIEAGPVEVEVVGTRFTVERSADQVFVHVERGAVLVRGNTVPDRVQRLNA